MKETIRDIPAQSKNLYIRYVFKWSELLPLYPEVFLSDLDIPSRRIAANSKGMAYL